MSGQQRRVSKVFAQSDRPRGTRFRGWGLLHDQIWFYDTPSKHLDYHDDAENGDPIYFDGRHYWRSIYTNREQDLVVRWLRFYMDRKMLWLPLGIRIRLHTFFSGDDNTAPHDHPWSFVTIPMSTYWETVEVDDFDPRMESPSWKRIIRRVRAWRPHYRPARYRHFVHEPDKPFRTIVIAWGKERDWGFWPTPNKFVNHRTWGNVYVPMPMPEEGPPTREYVDQDGDRGRK